MADIEATLVSRWSVGHNPEVTILVFESANRPPINLAIPHADAEKIAQAILAQLKNPPKAKLS